MAQLRDSVVQGSLRVTDSIFTNSLSASDLITARALEITDQNAISHITLPRDTYNYMSVPSGGELVLTSGTIMGTEYGIRIKVINNPKVTGGYISPGVTNKMTLGDSNLKWANVYATTFTGNLTGTASNITTTAANATAFIPVGVTSSATTTLLRATQHSIGQYQYTINDATNGGQQPSFKLVGKDYSILLMIGAGNTNRGIYQSSPSNAAKWLLYWGASNAHFNTGVNIDDSTASSSTSTGALIVSGGVGVAKTITANSLALTGAIDPHKVLIGPATGTTAAAPTWREPLTSDIQPQLVKTYPAYTCSANDANNGNIYFGKINITPISANTWRWQAPWVIRYRLYVETTEAATQGWYDCYFSVSGSTVNYYNCNNFYSNDYRPIYNHRLIYPKNTYSSYGGYLGARIQSARTPDTLARTYTIEILETRNCTIELFDNIKKQSEVYVTTDGKTADTIWYVTDYTASSVGLQEVGDANTNDTAAGYIREAGSSQTTIQVLDHTLYPFLIMLPSGNGQGYYGINATSKSLATTKSNIYAGTFNITEPIYYYPTDATVAVNSKVRQDRLWLMYAIDLRYSFNTGETLTVGKDVYMVATLQSATTAKLRNPTAKGTNASAQATGANAGPITQTLPSTEDGFIYIRLGRAYATTAITLSLDHTIYWYRNGSLQKYNAQYLSLISQESAYNLQNIVFANLNGTNKCRIGANTNGVLGIFSYGAMRLSPSCTSNTTIANEGIKIDATGLQPVVGNSELLGQSSYRWKDLYTNGLNITDYGTALPTTDLTPGRLFFQTSENEYELPVGGDAGSMLVKASVAERDVMWSNTIYNLTVTTNITAYGNITGAKVYNAVWNDYAECRSSWVEEPGRVIVESKNGTMELATERLMAGCKIISDTYGNLMGQSKTARTPIAVAGRVLAYPYQAREKYELGAAVCSGPNGTIDIMTREEIREYPERILGTVSEIPDYEVWHAGNEQNPTSIQVNGRIWIYVR